MTLPKQKAIPLLMVAKPVITSKVVPIITHPVCKKTVWFTNKTVTNNTMKAVTPRWKPAVAVVTLDVQDEDGVAILAEENLFWHTSSEE